MISIYQSDSKSIVKNHEKNFTNITDTIYRLTNSKATVRLYLELLRYIATKCHGTFIKKSQKFLASITECTDRTVRRALKKLSELGFITIIRRWTKKRNISETLQIFLKETDLFNIFKEQKKMRDAYKSFLLSPFIKKQYPLFSKCPTDSNTYKKNNVNHLGDKLKNAFIPPISSSSPLFVGIVCDWTTKALNLFGAKSNGAVAYIKNKVDFILNSGSYIRNIAGYLEKTLENLKKETSFENYIKNKDVKKQRTRHKSYKTTIIGSVRKITDFLSGDSEMIDYKDLSKSHTQQLEQIKDNFLKSSENVNFNSLKTVSNNFIGRSFSEKYQSTKIPDKSFYEPDLEASESHSQSNSKNNTHFDLPDDKFDAILIKYLSEIAEIYLAEKGVNKPDCALERLTSNYNAYLSAARKELFINIKQKYNKEYISSKEDYFKRMNFSGNSKESMLIAFERCGIIKVIDNIRDKVLSVA